MTGANEMNKATSKAGGPRPFSPASRAKPCFAGPRTPQGCKVLGKRPLEIRPVKELDAVFSAPPSKAHTLRALFISSLAEGKSVLKGALNADDQKVAAAALSQFGAEIEFDGDDFTVKGVGGRPTAPKKAVHTGNSGVTTRFIMPYAGLAKGVSLIDGDARMRERPVKEIADALGQLGVECKLESGKLPARVHGGNFLGGGTSVSGSESSQFLSGLLVSAPYSKNGVHVKVNGELKSKPYVDITMECMKYFGVAAVNRSYKEFFVQGGKEYKARTYQIEGDYSSASYFFAAAAITGGKAKVENLNPHSKQADKALVDILKKMGCKVKCGDDFIEIGGGELRSVNVDMGDCPDVVPTLAVVAAFADGSTEIKNIGHLAAKESNRIESVAKNLSACGIKVKTSGDSLKIIGGRPRGAAIDTFSDHRIAMAFSVMGLAVAGIKIMEPEAVSKSFPDFYVELGKAYGG